MRCCLFPLSVHLWQSCRLCQKDGLVYKPGTLQPPPPPCRILTVLVPALNSDDQFESSVMEQKWVWSCSEGNLTVQMSRKLSSEMRW